MGRSSKPDDKDTLLRFACGEYGPWILLLLPSGEYAPFWKQGFDTDNCIAIAEGRYKDAVPMMNPSREVVMQFMMLPLGD